MAVNARLIELVLIEMRAKHRRHNPCRTVCWRGDKAPAGCIFLIDCHGIDHRALSRIGWCFIAVGIV